MNAKQARYGIESLRALFAGARRVVVAKGKQAETVLLAGADWDELGPKLLGRSGNLRAPTARIGDTFVVGWSEAAWDEALR